MADSEGKFDYHTIFETILPDGSVWIPRKPITIPGEQGGFVDAPELITNGDFQIESLDGWIVTEEGLGDVHLTDYSPGEFGVDIANFLVG